ncbi:MAG: tetratricopeptide repeat protein [Neomegalonema sp.]|nr:tetratricopeptide repeat protein [Neomegalonema sp.]
MTTLDQFGLPLTLGVDADAEAAQKAWDATVRAFLAHSAATPTHLGATLQAAPNFALAHAAKGFFMLMLGRAELNETAAAALAAAEAHAPALTPRERVYVSALSSYVAGSLRSAADQLDALLRTTPEDGLAFKICHGLRFILGDAAGMRASAEAAIAAYDRNHPAHGYAKGCLAFALEECGAYAEAEQAGRAAVAAAPDDAWGLHAVAHVLDMTGRADEGVVWLGERPSAWAHCNNFGYHVWWHLALFHLERGEIEQVLKLYDTYIRAEKTDDYRDISNGASLLMRLEFEGADVGDRWEELATLSAGRTDDCCVVFADLHYMLALGAGKRQAEEVKLLRALQKSARASTGCQSRVADEVGVPAAKGLMAFAHGEYGAAFEALRNAAPLMPTVGGSHAQRDVFDRMTIEAALRAGRLEDAKTTIEARVARRGAMDAYAERRLARIGQLKHAAIVAAE